MASTSSQKSQRGVDAQSTRTALLSEQIGLCRICFEETDNRTLISPCKCSGTQAFVHRRCLKEMFAVTRKKACDVCKAPYELEYKGMRPWRQWTWPQPLGDQWEDEVDFKCSLLFLIFFLRVSTLMLLQGPTKTVEQVSAITGDGRMFLVWWTAFIINFVYYGDVLWHVTTRWLDENSVYEWKDNRKRAKIN